jgi:hypothetical protein
LKDVKGKPQLNSHSQLQGPPKRLFKASDLYWSPNYPGASCFYGRPRYDFHTSIHVESRLPEPTVDLILDDGGKPGHFTARSCNCMMPKCCYLYPRYILMSCRNADCGLLKNLLLRPNASLS